MSRVLAAKGKDITKRTLIALEKLSPRLPRKGSKILIKPNLVEPMPRYSGAITRPEVIEAIIQFFGDRNYKIYVGEGAAILDTSKCFQKAGYLHLQRKYNIKIVDLNQGGFIKMGTDGRYWREFEVAGILKEVDYLISAAVLKQHSFQVTLCLKNIMGVLKPGPRYPVKSYMHRENNMEIWAQRLMDLIFKVKPNLGVIDATTGMFGSHLSGRLKKFDITLVSEDVLACDIVGAKFLGYERVLHLDLALERKLGRKPSRVESIMI